MTSYIPLSSTDGDDERDYAALYEGAPEWIRRRLLEWIRGNLYNDQRRRWYQGAVDEIELDLKVSFSGSGSQLVSVCGHDERLLLNVVNWLLQHPDHRSDIRTVADVLSRGNSVWRVVGAESEVAHLERRVLRTLTDMAERAISASDASAEHLQNAWRDAWRIGGNPDYAYDQAVKAVESALKPIVSPRNDRTTLGTIIRDIETAPAKFSVRLEPNGEADGVATFLQSLKLLWQSQRRHGETESAVGASSEQAQDAISLATVVVDWVQRGAFRPHS